MEQAGWPKMALGGYPDMKFIHRAPNRKLTIHRHATPQGKEAKSKAMISVHENQISIHVHTSWVRFFPPLFQKKSSFIGLLRCHEVNSCSEHLCCPVPPTGHNPIGFLLPTQCVVESKDAPW